MEVLPSINDSKDENYQTVIKQIISLMEGEPDPIANLANASSILKNMFRYFSWVGFYRRERDELVLGPFQGKPACTRLKIGRGVCGTSYAEKRTVIVPRVEDFPGHIYCDPDSKSEIVVPIRRSDGTLWGVLDVDSDRYAAFDLVDAQYLEEMTELISKTTLN